MRSRESVMIFQVVESWVLIRVDRDKLMDAVT